jgi:hypothetical protein
MDFQHFLEYVPYLEAKLPAMAAHIKMVPFERTESLKNTFDEYKTNTAVMMLFIKEWDDTFGFNCTEFL